MIEPLEINGTPPALAGEICAELQCQQYWYRGALVQESLVVFLRFGEVWHRLYFDCGIIFWRVDNDSPTSYDAPEIQSSYRVMDIGSQLGVRGKRLRHYMMNPIERGSQVELSFMDGSTVIFRNIDDRTSVAA